MEVVESVKTKSGKPKFIMVDEIADNSTVRRKKGKIVHTSEQKNMIKSMIEEVRTIYRNAKKRGYSLKEEKVRYMELRYELMRLKAI